MKHVLSLLLIAVAGCSEKPRPEKIVTEITIEPPSQSTARLAISEFDSQEKATAIRRRVDGLNTLFKVKERISDVKARLESAANGDAVADDDIDDLRLELRLLQSKRIELEDFRDQQLKKLEQSSR